MDVKSDSKSEYEIDLTDFPDVESVLEQVDRLQDSIHCDMRERLEEENDYLKRSIRCSEQKLRSTANLLREAFEAYIVLDEYVKRIELDKKVVNDEWASFVLSGSL